MNAVLAVARASVLEHLRRKLVLFFLILLALATAGLVYLGVNDELAGNVTNVTIGLGTAASASFLPFLLTLATVAVSMNNIGRPFSDGEATLILARPLRRWQYAVGRLAGSIAVIAGLCAVTALLMQIVGLVEGAGFDGALWGHWGTTAFNLTILASITTLASAVVGAPVLAGFLSYFLYASSGIVSALYLLVTNSRVDGVAAAVITAAWVMTPRTLISPLVLRQVETISSTASLPDSVLLPTNSGRILWALAYLAVVVLLTFLVAERKELRG